MEKSITIDLTDLSELETERLNSFSRKLRYKYIDAVGKCSSRYQSKIEWYANPFSCRNTVYCNVYEDTVRVFYIIERLKYERVKKIITQNQGLKLILKNILPDDITIDVKNKIYEMPYIIKNIVDIAKYISAITLHYFLYWMASIGTAKKSEQFDANQLINVIETILYKESITKEGKFNDRHFPFINEIIKNKNGKKIIIFPTVYGVFNYYLLYKRSRFVGVDFLYTQDLLKYYECLKIPFNKKFHSLQINNFYIDDIDLTLLANHSLKYYKWKPAALLGIVKHEAIQRIKTRYSNKIKSVIRWHENHELDHMAVLGWRNLEPCPNIYGYYDSFPPENYLCPYPTYEEVLDGSYPDRMYVIGKFWIEELGKTSPKAEFALAATYRFNPKFEAKIVAESPSKKKMIFVPLPWGKKSKKLILKHILALAPDLNNWNIVIRPHPSDYSNFIKFNKYPNIKVDRGTSFNELLKKGNILISTASASLIQGLLECKYVIHLAERSRLSESVVPGSIKTDLYRSIYDLESLKDFINKVDGSSLVNRSVIDVEYYIADADNHNLISVCLK